MYFHVMFIQLPWCQVRLAQAIEACDGELNATCLSSLTESGLMRVLWLVTRQRPTVTIASLQCVGAQYSELNTKLLVRHRQLLSTAGPAFHTQIKELKAETELIDDLVQVRVDQWGFDQKWIDEVEASRKKKPKATAKATATGVAGHQQLLPELLQPVALPAAVPSIPANGIAPVAKAAAVPTPAAVPFAKAGPGPTPRVPVPSPTAASAVPPVASQMPPVAWQIPPAASSGMPPVASEMPQPPVASGNSNESNPDVAAGPTPEIPLAVGAAHDAEIEADLEEDQVDHGIRKLSQNFWY